MMNSSFSELNTRKSSKQMSPFVCSCRPILRIGRGVHIRSDSERSMVDFAAYVYFVLLFHIA
uniref:Uncharacterized protein n=1 Tax=Romanomermis culicivorax TaxID=13658 RepID=A0A915I2S7_ROMCU